MKLTRPLVLAGTLGLAFAGTMVVGQQLAGAAPETPAAAAGGCDAPASAADLAGCHDVDHPHGVFDPNDLDPTTQRWLAAIESGAPGEMSVYFEGPGALDPQTVAKCRVSLSTGTEGPLDPLYCNALVLTADGKIPFGHHYTEAELRQLAKRSS